MKKALVAVFLSIVACTLLLSFRKQNSTPNSGQVHITTSFYPLYEFAQQIGKDKVHITNITPAGSEPHDFEPTAKDIVQINTSKLFIYNGANMEPWPDKIIPDLQKNNVSILNLSKNIPVTNNNPHFWLDPVLATQEVTAIANAIIKIDPSNTNYYQKNVQDYNEQLNQLDTEIKTTLTTCTKKDIVTTHDAFGYYAKRYGLNVLPISGLSPDEEPTPQKLAEVVQFVKQHNVKYIFFESLVSPKLAQTIATETGAQTLTFNPIEGLTESEIQQGKNYISVQKENLNNLKIALECNP